MHDPTRLIPAGFLVLALAAPAWSNPPAPAEAKYQHSDTNFYFRRDVLKADPGAVILPESAFRQAEGVYFFQPRKKAPQEIYLDETLDWLEPVTPPSMPLSPAGLGIAPDAMQIREPQGEVDVALPADPSRFAPATDGETIPDGAVVKTGPNGTAAILFGGIDSARLAPNSQAGVEQTVTPELRSTRVDLKAGAVFSKVGLRPGQKQDYEVRTAFGTAKAKGTDFLTVTAGDHTDVFVAQGTVEFVGTDGKHLAEAHSTGKGELQVIQSVLAASGGKAPAPAVTDELTMAFNFIPAVNLKVKALRDKAAAGTALAPQEKKYLGLLRRVPVLVKLTLIAPSAPVVAAPPPPTPPSPPPPPPVSAPSPVPLHALVHADGTIDFAGRQRLLPEDFQAKLEKMMTTAPHTTLILRAGNDVPLASIKSLIDMGRKAGLQKVTLRVIPQKNEAPAVAQKPAAEEKPVAEVKPTAEEKPAGNGQLVTMVDLGPAKKPPVKTAAAKPTPASAPAKKPAVKTASTVKPSVQSEPPKKVASTASKPAPLPSVSAPATNSSTLSSPASPPPDSVLDQMLPPVKTGPNDTVP